MPRNGRATKRRRGNSGRAIELKTTKIGKVRSVRFKGTPRKSYRGKRKYNRKYGYDKRVMSQRQLTKALSKICMPSVRLNLGSHSGLAPIHRCMQRTYKRVVMTGDNFTVLVQSSLYPNNVVNPFNDSSATQPPGYDLLATIYANYVVLSAKVYARAAYDADDTYRAAANYWLERGVVADQADTWQKAKDYGFRMGTIAYRELANPLNKPGSSVKMSWRDTSKWLDGSGPGTLFATTGAAETGSAPAVNANCLIYCTENDGTPLTGQTLSFDIWITQEVVYFGLKPAVND